MIKQFNLILFFLISLILHSQTNPTPQTLPYSQTFSTLVSTSTTYPAGIQGWKVDSFSRNRYTNTTMSDQNMTASGTASSTTGTIYNYNGKIGMLASGSFTGGICLAITTINKGTITICYDVMTIRNPYNGTTNNRRNVMILQYRTNITDTFRTLWGSEYTNNTTIQSSGTTPQNIISKTVNLPAICNHKSVVQIRWVQKDSIGVGSRPSFAIDNILINNYTLPIELLDFTVQNYNSYNVLKWSTATEFNNEKFEIERLQFGDDWIKLSEVKSSGLSTTQVNYSYIDYNPSSINYYRIKQVDFDGTFSYSSIVKSQSSELSDVIEYYDMQGNKVNQLQFGKFYIRRRGDMVDKIYLIKTM
jgi:hypothetical protein